jgi:excisionase family DNA binding protein
VVALADAIRDGSATGDTELVRVANRTLTELLGAEDAVPAEVVDIVGRALVGNDGGSMSNEMMDYDEAARYLGLPLGTLYSMVSRKRIPHVRLGPRLERFPRADLDGWVQERMVMPEVRRANEGRPARRTIH